MGVAGGRKGGRSTTSCQTRIQTNTYTHAPASSQLATHCFYDVPRACLYHIPTQRATCLHQGLRKLRQHRDVHSAYCLLVERGRKTAECPVHTHTQTHTAPSRKSVDPRDAWPKGEGYNFHTDGPSHNHTMQQLVARCWSTSHLNTPVHQALHVHVVA